MAYFFACTTFHINFCLVICGRELYHGFFLLYDEIFVKAECFLSVLLATVLSYFTILNS